VAAWLTTIERTLQTESARSPKEEIPMTKARRFVISICWAMLSSALLVCAQDVKPSKPTLALQGPPVIRELDSRLQRSLRFPLQAQPVSASAAYAPDLSRYRDFQLGMDLLGAAKRADMQPSEARVVHQRPALIQEMEWRPQRPLDTSLRTDSVKEVLFSFYNGELFRIVVNYDRHRTEGMTDEDMVEAISTKYGTATKPAAKMVTFSSFQVYNDSEKVIARWENSEYSCSLFRSTYQPTFGMLVLEKRLDGLAQSAITEANRLDAQEGPQREAERQKKQDGEERAAQEKVREASKEVFRP